MSSRGSVTQLRRGFRRLRGATGERSRGRWLKSTMFCFGLLILMFRQRSRNGGTFIVWKIGAVLLCCTWKGFPPRSFYLPPQYVQIQDQRTESWPKEQFVCLFGRNHSDPEAAPCESWWTDHLINTPGLNLPVWTMQPKSSKNKTKKTFKVKLNEGEILTLVSLFLF